MVPAAARAQDAIDVKVAERLAAAQAAYGAVAPSPRCTGGSDDEIVVCAPGDSGRYRVPSTAETDPFSRAARRALDGNLPTAPDLAPHYPGVSVAHGCFIPPCPGPPVYAIDVKAIPEAPEGSDADAVANGRTSDR